MADDNEPTNTLEAIKDHVSKGATLGGDRVSFLVDKFGVQLVDSRIPKDNHGHRRQPVHIEEPFTSYGEIPVAQLTPLVQLQFQYSVNPRLVRALSDGSGTASVTNSLLTLSTGTDAGSDVLLESVEHAKEHPGQGGLVRWTSIFPESGTNGTEVAMGLGNEEDMFGYGYLDDSNGNNVFGLLHRFGGTLEFRTVTFTTGSSGSGTVTINLEGAGTETELSGALSVQGVAREVGATSYAGYETQVIGGDVVFISHLAETKSGTFSFVDTDTTGAAATGGLVQSIAGSPPTNDFIPQSHWNGDRLDGQGGDRNASGMNLNHAKGNIYEVQYQWLGFGAIDYSIEDESTGLFTLVHQIKYANRHTVPSIQNPTLPLYASVKNGSTTTDIILKGASMAAFTEGVVDESQQGLQNGASGTLSGDLTTETAILAVKNKPIFQSSENRVEWAPKLFTFSADGSGGASITTLRVHLNPVLGGNPVFTDVSTATSIIAVDTAGTTLTGGNVVATFSFGGTVPARILDLTTFTVNQPPGSLVVFAVTIDQGTSAAEFALIWRELF